MLVCDFYHVSLYTHLFKPDACNDDLFLDVLDDNKKSAFYILQKSNRFFHPPVECINIVC